MDSFVLFYRAILGLEPAPILDIPENYYDDLAARHGLDDDFTADLKRLNLPYDRDVRREFSHGYTETFDDRFFYEIVERNGCRRFGAHNATVRLDVQAQRRESRRAGARMATL